MLQNFQYHLNVFAAQIFNEFWHSSAAFLLSTLPISVAHQDNEKSIRRAHANSLSFFKLRVMTFVKLMQ